MVLNSRPDDSSSSCKIILLQFVLLLVRASGLEDNNNNEKMVQDFPGLRSGRLYFAIAASPSGQTFSRAFNKTLMNITQSYVTTRFNNSSRDTFNFSLDTLVIEFPENGGFSVNFLRTLCERFESKHVVAVLILGECPAAFTVSLAAKHSGIPVLWAGGHSGYLPGFRSLESSPLEVQLAPTGRELVQALRGLLLQAHWHTFTLLVDSGSAATLRRPELWSTLEAPPLHPTLIALPSPMRAQSLFRKLADISRSTRGVVVLLSDRTAAVRILEEARRLNMMDGHFVWVWIDTAANVTFKNTSNFGEPDDPAKDPTKDKGHPLSSADDRYKRSTSTGSSSSGSPSKSSVIVESDISDMHVNYLLKNDQFLLFNRNPYGVESSKFTKERNNIEPTTSTTATTDRRFSSFPSASDGAAGGELPAGLLSLKALPVRVDRHLVKGAVRLLVATLKTVLNTTPLWMLQSMVRGQLLMSCWKPLGAREYNFSTTFGRELKAACTNALAGKKFTQEIGVDKVDKSLVANFEILNLVPERSTKDAVADAFSNRTSTSDNIVIINNATGGSNSGSTGTPGTGVKWKRVGMVSGRSVRLDTIIWPGGDLAVAAVSTRARTVFRIVTALAPPFVMESELDEDGQCLRGLPCHRVLTSDKDNLTLVFNEMRRLEDEEEDNANNNNINEEESSGGSGGGGGGAAAGGGSTTGNYGGGGGGGGNSKQQFNSDYDEAAAERFFPFQKFKYRTNCCYGLSMDLLENIAQELEFDFRLYIVADGFFGSKMLKQRKARDVSKKYPGGYRYKDEFGHPDSQPKPDTSDFDVQWNGVVGDLVSGAAHMSFSALSVSSARSEVIDFSVPYFYSGVSLLAAPQQTSEIPLMAFLLPFSPELWIAIFTSLNITAIAVAIYEWLSPFGLNPWGRQRSKNFSMSSALWVMWGLLCGHLVAFKAPKSWPNKFLINVWGGFSVIFVASYTANIAALIAGLFFHNTVSNYRDSSLLTQRVGAPKSTAAEYYVQKANRLLWQHMYKYSLENIEEGIERLRNGSLDVLIADTPVLDYYRATDHGCKLQKFGDTINEDTYAIGMTKGFPLKDSISAVIAKYSNNGYMDILQEKWYGGLPCFKLATDIAQPRPLGVAAVTGVFILLGVGIALGLLILLVEHLFFRYTLPILRDKPKGSIWRSRNIMFFSQKLYRFINCVELVSPHHAARELVHTIRQGQITSLFQKSIKRKEHEQRRRRKSKAQFFEMIQEIRRQQLEEREPSLAPVTEVDSEHQMSPEEKKSKLSPSILRRTFMRTSPKADTAKIKSPTTYFNRQLFSPRSKNKARSSTQLNVRRFSTDSVFNSQTLKFDHNSAVGRRLSKDASAFLTSSPPDINSRRSSYLDIISSGNKLSGKSPVLSIENVSDCSFRSAEPMRKLSDSESIGKKLATLPKYREPMDRHRLQPQYSLTLGKSDETISKSEIPAQVTPAKSFNNVSDQLADHGRGNLSDDEIALRNKQTIEQLQAQFKTTISSSHTNKNKPRSGSSSTTTQIVPDNNNKANSNKTQQQNQNTNTAATTTTTTTNTNNNPQIRIQVEDTTTKTTIFEPVSPQAVAITTSSSSSTSGRHPPLSRRSKTRHQSLGDTSTLLGQAPRNDQSGNKTGSGPGSRPEPVKRNKLGEQSRSLDNTGYSSSSGSKSNRKGRKEEDLPPAPPPPNCSPRNSNGRSPLERLSKDELVLLWRSSESELRSHLLKAIRDKEEPSKPP